MKRRKLLLTISLAGMMLAASADTLNVQNEQFTLLVDGHRQQVPMVTVHDRAYVSVRPFCDAVGMDVEWDQQAGAISVQTQGTPALNLQEVLTISEETALAIGKAVLLQMVGEEAFAQYQQELFTADDYYDVHCYRGPIPAPDQGFSIRIRKTDGRIMALLP